VGVFKVCVDRRALLGETEAIANISLPCGASAVIGQVASRLCTSLKERGRSGVDPSLIKVDTSVKFRA